MADATAPPDPTASWLRELLASCRELMADEPDEHPTLRDAWLTATGAERDMTSADYQWEAETEWINRGYRTYRGRIAYAGPRQPPGRPRLAPPAALRRRIKAHWPWCIYCGGLGTDLDHIWPWILGGTNHRTNLAPCCERCNSGKRDKSVSEWRAHRLGTGRTWPPEPYWSDLVRNLLLERHGVTEPPRGPSCLR